MYYANSFNKITHFLKKISLSHDYLGWQGSLLKEIRSDRFDRIKKGIGIYLE